MNLPANTGGEKLRHITIDSVDQMKDYALRIGIDSYCAQLGESFSGTRILQGSHDSLTATRIAFGSPLYLRARSLPGNLILGTCESVSRASINGLPVKPQHCFLVMPGAQVDLFTLGPATLRMVTVPTAESEAQADSLVCRLRRALTDGQVYVGGAEAESRHLRHWFRSWEGAEPGQNTPAPATVTPRFPGLVYRSLQRVLQNLQCGPNHRVTDAEWAGSGVKRLIDYFHDNPQEWISIDDACGLAQMRRRNLYYQFSRHTGLSPQRYFSRVRLSYLRQELTACDASITELALKYNFHHLGDFSATYRSVYGELPSDTRKNAEHSERMQTLELLNWRRA